MPRPSSSLLPPSVHSFWFGVCPSGPFLKNTFFSICVQMFKLLFLFSPICSHFIILSYPFKKKKDKWVKNLCILWLAFSPLMMYHWHLPMSVYADLLFPYSPIARKFDDLFWLIPADGQFGSSQFFNVIEETAMILCAYV